MDTSRKREILETLLEQGFIEFVEPAREDMELLEELYKDGIVDKPRFVGGSYGAVLIDNIKLLEKLKQIE